MSMSARLRSVSNLSGKINLLRECYISLTGILAVVTHKYLWLPCPRIHIEFRLKTTFTQQANS